MHSVLTLARFPGDIGATGTGALPDELSPSETTGCAFPDIFY